jgi:DnaK suppressor protein
VKTIKSKKASVRSGTARRGKAATGKSGSKSAGSRASGKKASRSTPKTKAKKRTAKKRSGTETARAKKRTAGATTAPARPSGTATAGTNRRAKTGTKKTKSKPSALSAALAAVNRAAITRVPEDRPLPKTKLNAKDLAEFRELLLAKRAELIGDVGNLSGEALGKNRRDAAGDLSIMPIHMADLGSDNWEQEFTLGLLDNERRLLREIDEALARIEDRTYGICLATHRPITKTRLRAKPWAQYCIEYARALEAGRAP